MKKYSITIQANSSEKVKEQFNYFLSAVEKDFKSFFGEFTFSFEDIIGSPHKEQKGT